MTPLAGLLLAALAVPTPADKPSYQVKQLTERLYELSIDGGGYPVKVIASVGPDGLLLVDTGAPNAAPALVETLDARGWGRPRVVINTHSHIEHLGGNPALGKVPVIIGQARLRERYLDGLYAFSNYPEEALPNLTFEDSLSLHWNGEEIRVVALPGAHDSSDTVVWFTGSRVAVVGALCMGNHFPSIDGDTSDIRKYPEVTAKLLALVPDDVTFVPAHAEDCGKAECRRFQEMLVATSDLIRRGLAAGKDLATLQKEDVLAPWASFESSYVKRGEWIEYWAEALAPDWPDFARRPRPFAPLHQAFVEKGAEGAIARWRELRATAADRYTFDANTLFWAGRRLVRIDRTAEGAKLLDFCIAEFPGSEGAFMAHGVLGNVAFKAGDKQTARIHYQEYLRKFPEDEDVSKRLAELASRKD